MNRLQTYYENLKISLKLAILGSVLVGMGSLLGNPYIHEIFKLDTASVTQITQTLLVCGSLILTYFPITVFVKLLQMRIEDKNIVVIGLTAYAAFLVAVLLFAPQTLAPSAYVKGISYSIANTSFALMRTGTLGLAGVYIIVKFIYSRPLSSKYFNVLSIFSANVIRLTNSFILAFAFGFVFATYWPTFINWIYSSLRFIASDVYNPMSLFAYGGLDRITALFGMNSIVKSEMWLGSLGGTWNGLDNVTYIGDINIWNAQLKSNLAVLGIGGAGRYSTAFYVMNIFAIPGYMLAIFTTVSDKKRRNRSIGTLIGATLLSMLSGVLLQTELFMILTTPLIYIFHIFMISFVNAILTGFSVTLGFSYLNVLEGATPGTLIDLFGLNKHNVNSDQIMILVLFGLIIFVIYYVTTRFYYTKIAMDVLNVGSKDDETTDFIERLGGLKNIVSISSMTTRIIVLLKDDDDINVEGLHHQGVSRIVKSRAGYILSYGAGSYMLQREVNKRLTIFEQTLEQEDV